MPLTVNNVIKIIYSAPGYCVQSIRKISTFQFLQLQGILFLTSVSVLNLELVTNMLADQLMTNINITFSF